MLWWGDGGQWESLPFRCPVAKDQETAEDIGDCLILLMNNSLKANSPPQVYKTNNSIESTLVLIVPLLTSVNTVVTLCYTVVNRVRIWILEIFQQLLLKVFDQSFCASGAARLRKGSAIWMTPDPTHQLPFSHSQSRLCPLAGHLSWAKANV